jgi:hypothetical protein
MLSEIKILVTYFCEALEGTKINKRAIVLFILKYNTTKGIWLNGTQSATNPKARSESKYARGGSGNRDENASDSQKSMLVEEVIKKIYNHFSMSLL